MQARATRVSSIAIAAHDLEAGTESPSVIAVHTRRRQLTSLNLQGVQGSVAGNPASACRARTASLQAFRAEVSSLWTSL
jgi:hypothetical protein